MDYIDMIMGNNYQVTGSNESYEFRVDYMHGADDTLQSFIDELSDQLSKQGEPKTVKKDHEHKKLEPKSKKKLEPKSKKPKQVPRKYENIESDSGDDESSADDKSSADGIIENNSSFDELSADNIEADSGRGESSEDYVQGALEIDELINDFESREF